MRILYVEDNLANVSLVKRIARNHTVISYIDGEDALRNFDRDQPDLVLMDIQLAGHLNGLDVVQKLRAAGHKVPIIAVTAYAMIGDRERCLAGGCDEYIAKPLPIPKLVELIERYDKITKARDTAEVNEVSNTSGDEVAVDAATKEKEVVSPSSVPPDKVSPIKAEAAQPATDEKAAVEAAEEEVKAEKPVITAEAEVSAKAEVSKVAEETKAESEDQVGEKEAAPVDGSSQRIEAELQPEQSSENKESVK